MLTISASQPAHGKPPPPDPLSRATPRLREHPTGARRAGHRRRARREPRPPRRASRRGEPAELAAALGDAHRPARRHERPHLTGLGPRLAPVRRDQHGRVAQGVQRLPAEAHGVLAGALAEREALARLRAARGERRVRRLLAGSQEGRRRRAARLPALGRRAAAGGEGPLHGDRAAALGAPVEVRREPHRFGAALRKARDRRSAPPGHDRPGQGPGAREGAREGTSRGSCLRSTSRATTPSSPTPTTGSCGARSTRRTRRARRIGDRWRASSTTRRSWTRSSRCATKRPCCSGTGTSPRYLCRRRWPTRPTRSRPSCSISIAARGRARPPSSTSSAASPSSSTASPTCSRGTRRTTRRS